MDSQNSKNDETRWVEERMAQLCPPPGWKPDTDKAFERVLHRTTPAAMPRGARLAMAGATVAVIGLVLSQLPWQVLWKPKDIENPIAAQQPNTEPATTTGPTPAPPSEAQNPPAQEDRQNRATTGPAPAEPQRQPERLKKNPRIVASVDGEVFSVAEKGPRVISTAQGQGQPAPPEPPASVTLPVVVYQVQPEYTPEGREARAQGTVELVATVREDGTVKVERVTKSIGYGLDESAAAAVEKWRFRPGTKDGQPVAVTTTINVSFSLR